MPYAAFARQSVGDAPYEHSGERLLNWYAEPFPDGGTGRLTLQPSPGLTDFTTLGGSVRAVYVEQGVIYAAAGGALYSVTEAGVATSLGAIADDAFTTITGNGFDIAVTAGGNYYVYNKAAGTLSTVATVVFSRARSATRLDNYIIVSQESGQTFVISGLADASSIDALDFASAEGAPDNIVRAFADHSELWFFGDKVTEIWTNTGAADFPFQRISGGVIERGCAFPGSVAQDDNSIWWIGDDRLVYRAQGYSPQVVSTPWVAEQLQEITADDVSCFAYSWRGHKFYTIRRPGRTSLTYDVATGLWHERSSGLDGNPWRATCSARLGEKTIMGGSDGVLYTLGGLTDGGEAILREAVSLPLENGGEDFSMAELEIQFQTGVTDKDDAQAVLQISRNGREWGKERWKSLGSLGSYLKRARWLGLGNERQFRARVRVTDQIETALIGARYRVG